MLNKLSRIYEYLEHLKMEKDRENMNKHISSKTFSFEKLQELLIGEKSEENNLKNILFWINKRAWCKKILTQENFAENLEEIYMDLPDSASVVLNEVFKITKLLFKTAKNISNKTESICAFSRELQQTCIRSTIPHLYNIAENVRNSAATTLMAFDIDFSNDAFEKVLTSLIEKCPVNQFRLVANTRNLNNALVSFVSIAKNTSKSTRRKLGFSLKINKVYNKNSNYERIIKKVSDMLLEDGLSNPNNEEWAQFLRAPLYKYEKEMYTAEKQRDMPSEIVPIFEECLEDAFQKNSQKYIQSPSDLSNRNHHNTHSAKLNYYLEIYKSKTSNR